MTSLSADTKCPLIELPSELRNRIWSFCTVFDDAVLVLRERPTDPDHDTTTQAFAPYFQPALGFTSHQVRNESLSIFYSENVFHIATIYGKTRETKRRNQKQVVQRLSQWRKYLGPWLKHLRGVYIAAPSDDSLPFTNGSEIVPATEDRVHHFGAAIKVDGSVTLQLWTDAADTARGPAVNRMSVCTCSLQKGTRARGPNKKRGDGKLLLHLVQEVCIHYFRQSWEFRCDVCGLEVYYKSL